MNIRAMWIDDDTDFLATMKTGLEKAGARSGIDLRVFTEKDPREALRLLEKHDDWPDGQPHIFFIDFVMPYLDGADVVNGIVSSTWIKDPIIIYVTGSKQFVDSEELRSMGGKLAGYDAILKGTINVMELFEDIRSRIVGRSRLSR